MKNYIIPVFEIFLLVICTECSYNQDDAGDTFVCGVQRITKNEVIVRGQDAVPGSWPWHGAIYHRRSGRSEKYACGGTLVSLTFVLTAEHCVKDSLGRVVSNSQLLVRFGVHDLTRVDATIAQSFDVLQIHRYEELESARDKLNNDIALLELSGRVRLSNHVQPACINQEADLVDQYGVVAGWGVTESDKTSAILKIARMPVISHLNCLKSNRDLFGSTLDDSLICAGHTNGTTVCNGDSGGGLLFKRDDRWYIGGIVAFTALRDYSLDLCSTEGYAAFTGVFFFLRWIADTMGLEYLKIKGGSVFRDAVTVDPSRNYNNYLPKHCGITLVNRIVSGQNARLFEHPWMAILIYPLDVRFNTGTIISKRYVLTTANAVVMVHPYKVRLGDYILDQVKDCDINDKEDCAPPVQDYAIEYIIRHQSYSKAIRTKPNDIALIRLKLEISFEDHIQPICLPTTRWLRQMRLPEYVISGWGYHDSSDQYSPVLLKARVPLVGQPECQRWFNELSLSSFRIMETHICAGRDNTADACTGDGGGPLGFAVQSRGVQFVQFGIIAFGIGCGGGPAVYTNVSHHMAWIMANMVP